MLLLAGIACLKGVSISCFKAQKTTWNDPGRIIDVIVNIELLKTTPSLETDAIKTI